MSNENVRYILDALRHWEITLSRAMELLEMEAAGNFTQDMLPKVFGVFDEDEIPMETFNRVVAERDGLAETGILAGQEVERLRQVCGEAYQLAGALGASVEALDNLAAAMMGQPLPHASFLPVVVEQKDALYLSKNDVEFLATRVRRLCAHFDYPILRGDDEFVVSVAGSLIGGVLSNIAVASRPLEEDDESHPLWGINEQIKGLLEGDGSGEDHEDVVEFLLKTGLPRTTVDRIHRAIVWGDTKVRPGGDSK